MLPACANLYVVIPNKKLFNAYNATYNAFDLGDNIFGMTAAYTKGEEWLEENAPIS